MSTASFGTMHSCPSTSEHDAMQDESDMEQLSDLQSILSEDSVSHWVGKQHLIYSITVAIAKITGTRQISIQDADFTLWDILTKCDFSAVAAAFNLYMPLPFQGLGSRRTRDSFLAAAGHIVRYGRPDQIEEVDSLISSMIRSSLSQESDPSTPTVVLTGLGGGETLGRRRFAADLTAPNEDIELPRFTMALYKHSDRNVRMVPRYFVDQLTIVPPVFQSEVVVDGARFVGGRASTRKRARHLASQEACTRLEIRV